MARMSSAEGRASGSRATMAFMSACSARETCGKRECGSCSAGGAGAGAGAIAGDDEGPAAPKANEVSPPPK